MTTKTLSDLNVGDCVTALMYGNPVSIKKITRITKTLIITGDSKWSKSAGFPHAIVVPTTDEHRLYIQRGNLEYMIKEAINSTILKRLSMEQLQQIAAVLGINK